MEDMATGEIRLSILWEWLHKGGQLTEGDEQLNLKQDDVFTLEIFNQMLNEEYEKLIEANNKDVHDDSKQTTLPIAKEITETYVLAHIKAPWYIDLLNINIDNHELSTAGKRIIDYMDTLKKDNSRITKNVDFVVD
jgi:malate synthase